MGFKKQISKKIFGVLILTILMAVNIKVGLNFDSEKATLIESIELSLNTNEVTAQSPCVDRQCFSSGFESCKGTECQNKWICGDDISCDCSFDWVKYTGDHTTGKCNYPQE